MVAPRRTFSPRMLGGFRQFQTFSRHSPLAAQGSHARRTGRNRRRKRRERSADTRTAGNRVNSRLPQFVNTPADRVDPMPVVITLTNASEVYHWWDENNGEEPGIIYALGGIDTVEGDAGADVIYGGDGGDVLLGGIGGGFGEPGNDILY